MNRSSVLVTGGAGYIGSHTVLALLDAGYPVVVIDNLSASFRGAVDRRATFHEGAIENESFVRSVMEFQNVVAVMHFAGSIDAHESVANPLKYYRNNSSASRSLIESAVACGVPHFIFCSTAETYGLHTQLPIPETAIQNPVTPYGMSNLVTEAILADTAAAHDFNYCALRCLHAAGADPQGRGGPSATSSNHMIMQAIEAVLGKRKGVTIHGSAFQTPDGSAVRDYVHVSDLAAAHVAALEALLAEPTRSLRLNCGYGRGFSVVEILDAVERATNVRIERISAPAAPGEPAAVVIDNRAILRELDWKPRFANLDEIVRSTYRWEIGFPRLASDLDKELPILRSTEWVESEQPAGTGAI